MGSNPLTSTLCMQASYFVLVPLFQQHKQNSLVELAHITVYEVMRVLHSDKLRRDTSVPLKMTVIDARQLQRPASKPQSFPQSSVRTVLGCAAGTVTVLTGRSVLLPLGDAQRSDFSSLLTSVSQREHLPVVFPGSPCKIESFLLLYL